MKRWSVCAAALAFVSVLPVLTLAKTANVVNQDYMIVLDQSGSMREKVPGNPNAGYEKDPRQAHKSRGAVDALDVIVTKMLQDGDYFSLVNFGNASDVVFSQEMSFPHERELFRRAISTMNFGDKKTDILAGIKEASDLMISMNTPQRRKVFILITDGKNEPPDDSPYRSEEAQEEFYRELRDVIKANKWDMTLVGIGEYTEDNIREIAEKLDLPFEKAIVVNNPQSSEEIQQKLTRIFEEKRDERVLLQAQMISLVFKPDWFGKYNSQSAALQLDSSFTEAVSIQFDPQNSVMIENGDELGLRLSLSPQQLSIAPQQSASFTVHAEFSGNALENRRLSGKVLFQLDRDSVDFSPRECEIEAIVKSWAEVYGLIAGLAVAVLAVAFFLLVLAIRKAQAPEIRIEVMGDNKNLGSPMTLKKKQSFTIANDDFSGKSVSAKPLSCKTAASVKYLGRRKFQVSADEAVIIDSNNKEAQTLVVGMDSFFDLKDSDGKVLRGITITNPGKGGGDMFGSGGGDDIF